MNYGFHILNKKFIKLMTSEELLMSLGYHPDAAGVVLSANGNLAIIDCGVMAQYLDSEDYVPIFNKELE